MKIIMGGITEGSSLSTDELMALTLWYWPSSYEDKVNWYQKVFDFAQRPDSPLLFCRDIGGSWFRIDYDYRVDTSDFNAVMSSLQIILPSCDLRRETSGQTYLWLSPHDDAIAKLLFSK